MARIGWLDRVLRLLSDVRGGEALTALLFASALFVGLFAYYVLKTLREPLILATGGAEVRSYATGAQALGLMALVPAYGWVARRVDRSKLVLGSSAFFLVCLELFALLAHFRVPYIGIAFFVWLGVFVLSSVAQIWSLANDVYPQQQGRRLFPIVALGAPLGSALGAYAAGHLFSTGVAIPPSASTRSSLAITFKRSLVNVTDRAWIFSAVPSDSAPGNSAAFLSTRRC